VCADVLDMKHKLRLSPSVVLREEAFGGIIMDYRGYSEGESKIYFVKSKRLMSILSRLDGSAPLETVLSGGAPGEALGTLQLKTVLDYLSMLVGKGVLVLV